MYSIASVIFRVVLSISTIGIASQAKAGATINGRPALMYGIQGASRCTSDCHDSKTVFIKSVDDGRVGAVRDAVIPYGVHFEVTLKNETYRAYPLVTNLNLNMRQIYQLRDLEDPATQEKIATSLKMSKDQIDFTASRVNAVFFIDSHPDLFDSAGNPKNF